MKNKDVLEFYDGLTTLRAELPGRVFNHAVILNLKQIKPFAEALIEAQQPTGEMLKYLEELEVLKKEFAEKDDNGAIIYKDGVDKLTGSPAKFYTIPDSENPETPFFKEKTALYEKYKDAIDGHAKLVQEWQDQLLEQDSEFDPIHVPLNTVPDDINQSEMAGIIYMINGQ